MNLYTVPTINTTNLCFLNKNLEDQVIKTNHLIIQTIIHSPMKDSVREKEMRYVGSDVTIITKNKITLLLPNKNLNELTSQGQPYLINKLFKYYYNSRRCYTYKPTIYYEDAFTGKTDYKIVELYQTTYTSDGINMVFKLKKDNSLHQSNMEIKYDFSRYTYLFPDYMKEIKGLYMTHIRKNIEEFPMKTSQDTFEIVQKIEKYKENKIYFEVNGLLRNIIYFYNKKLRDPLNKYDNKLHNQRDYVIQLKKDYKWLIPSTRILRSILTITALRGELPYLPQEILENIIYFV